MASETQPRDPSEDARRRARRVAIVAGAILVVGLVAPLVAASRRPPPARAPAHGPARAAATAAAQAALSLGSAVSALERARAALDERDAPPVPPDPREYPSPTACARSYLPDVDVRDASLDVLCTETDLWALERDVDVRLAHREGGAHAWTRLGRYSLAAVAMLRSGCCPVPEPLTAVVPGLWCGVLRDELRLLGPAPSYDQERAHEKTMACLEGRGAHLPDRWMRFTEEESRSAFESLLAVARARKTAAPAAR